MNTSQLADGFRVHTFASSRDAYDDCQCDDRIRTGDTIHIPSESVVGVAGAWPIAVTFRHGELHHTREGITAEAFIAEGFGTLTLEHIRKAQAFARQQGYVLLEGF